VAHKPLTVAWISDFPVEWLPEPPEALRASPRRHPATWQMVLLSEFEKDPALRVHVILLRSEPERAFQFERNGAVFHVLKAPPWLRLGSLFWADTLLIGRVCRRIQPDLVHAWGMEKGAPLVAHRLGRPYVMTVQGLFGWYRQRVPMARYDRFIARLEPLCLRRAPVVTTESNYAVGYLKARYPGTRIQQAEHAPNRAFFQVRRQPRLQPVRFISIGTLGFRKGTDLLFQGLDRLRQEMAFTLEVISGPNADYLATVRPMVSAALWERVQFKPHILPREVAQELETATLMLLPTRADVSPNAVKECVVAGVPVVASSTGGVPDYVFPGKNGLLFPPGDLEGFVAALRTAVQHPLFSRGQVDAAALAQSRDYLSAARMARNFLTAYRMAVVKRPPAGAGPETCGTG
jgi:glycosyltransferase involved in cell wall biosynthesis